MGRKSSTSLNLKDQFQNYQTFPGLPLSKSNFLIFPGLLKNSRFVEYLGLILLKTSINGISCSVLSKDVKNSTKANICEVGWQGQPKANSKS